MAASGSRRGPRRGAAHIEFAEMGVAAWAVRGASDVEASARSGGKAVTRHPAPGGCAAPALHPVRGGVLDTAHSSPRPSPTRYDLGFPERRRFRGAAGTGRDRAVPRAIHGDPARLLEASPPSRGPAKTLCMLGSSFRHPHRVLRAYVEHYNTHRPHRALHLKAPSPRRSEQPRHHPQHRIERRDLLGGLIHDYETVGRTPDLSFRHPHGSSGLCVQPLRHPACFAMVPTAAACASQGAGWAHGSSQNRER
jgi:hypothetical protein